MSEQSKARIRVVAVLAALIVALPGSFAAAQKIFPEVSELEANCRQNREAWRALGARASADRASG